MEEIMWYVNHVLCQTESRRDEMAMFYFAQGQAVEIRPVPRTEQGWLVVPLTVEET